LDQGYAVGLYSNGSVAMPEFDGERAAPPSHGKPPQTLTSAEQTAKDLDIQRARAAASLRLRIPPASRPEQATRLLDGLARLLPYYGHPMHDILTTEGARLPFGATIVFIGTETAVDVPLILALRQLRARGHAITLLLAHSDLAGDAADGARYLADLPVHYIGGRERWQELAADVLGPDAGRRASSFTQDRTHANASQADAPAGTASLPGPLPTRESDAGQETDFSGKEIEPRGASGADATPPLASDWRRSRPLVVE
ncbi:MAG: hypothetical protein ACRDHP_16545, partial [Ktedonobacterales bacterium]